MTHLIAEKLIDTFVLNSSKWAFNEDVEQGSESKIDGEHVIGRVVGPMFLVDGVSQNQRFYSKGLWERAIANSQDKFSQGGMLGTIGHEKAIDEDCIREGGISHLVTNLWIEDGVGMGEIKILNSPAGRTLNSLMRAGYQIPVSSRAYGTYSGKTNEGQDVVDPNTFDLRTFDFVLNPGVGYAYPKIVESTETNQPIEEKITMDLEKLMERQTSQNEALQTKLTESLSAQSTLIAEKAELSKALDEAKKVAAFYNKKVGNIADTKITESAFRKWMEFEPWKSVAREMGLFDQDGLNMTKVTNKLLGLTESQHKEVTDLKAKLAESEKTIAQLQENKAAYEKFGTAKEVEALCKITASYAKVGKPQELIEKLAKANEANEKIEDARRKNAARKIEEKLGVPKQHAYEAIKKMGVKAAVDMFKSLNKKTELKDRYTVTESKPSAKGAETKVETASGSLTSRFFESMNPRTEWKNPQDEYARQRGMGR